MIEFDMVVLTKSQISDLAKQFPDISKDDKIVVLQNDKKRSEIIARDTKSERIVVIG